MTDEQRAREVLGREAAIARANEACRNMDGELDLDAMTRHFIAFAQPATQDVSEERAKLIRELCNPWQDGKPMERGKLPDWAFDLLQRAAHALSAQPATPAEGEASGWIVGSADGKQFRTWTNGFPEWTGDREQATRYARRVDAESVHREDEDAWLIEPFLCKTAPAEGEAFQARVQPWLMACFGPEIAGDREERNHRFLEEALELVQSCGCTASEAHQLVDYVFGREVGEPAQEVGGVMVTLAALCLANGLDMHENGETELARIWSKVDAIREKQAAKPKHSPLPAALPAPVASQGVGEDATTALDAAISGLAGWIDAGEQYARRGGSTLALDGYVKTAIDEYRSRKGLEPLYGDSRPTAKTLAWALDGIAANFGDELLGEDLAILHVALSSPCPKGS